MGELWENLGYVLFALSSLLLANNTKLAQVKATLLCPSATTICLQYEPPSIMKVCFCTNEMLQLPPATSTLTNKLANSFMNDKTFTTFLEKFS